jgi:hypothetical protein
MTKTEETNDGPLLIEVTPEIAYYLDKILKHLPDEADVTTIEQLIAIAVSQFAVRLDNGDTQFVLDTNSEQAHSATEVTEGNA